MKETLRNVWENFKDFFTRDWTLEEKILVVLCCVLIGVIKGFCLAPIKNGVKMGCNNGNNNGNTFPEADDYWLDDED